MTALRGSRSNDRAPGGRAPHARSGRPLGGRPLHLYVWGRRAAPAVSCPSPVFYRAGPFWYAVARLDGRCDRRGGV